MSKVHIKHYCLVCEELTLFQVNHTHSAEASDGCEEEYSIGTCSECMELAVFYREDVALCKNQFGDEPEYIRAFPVPEDNRSLSYVAPESVSKPYYEAVHAESEGLWLSAAVMLGKSLEALCKHFRPDSTSIFDGLNKLHSDGLLSKKMLDWGHDLRVIRNQAAHSTESDIIEWDVSVAFDFFRALVVMLFEIDHYYAVYKEAKQEYEANK
ncbi:MAG: DUF4145 domain-containing protein [Neptuniibacter sp.]